MKYMRGERMLMESDTGELVLTTHRVRYESSRPGEADLTSIMLEQICQSEISHTSKFAFLILAMLFAVTIIGGILFLLAYLWSRRQVVSLHSAAGAITIPTRGMSLESAKDFIDSVEEAKDARYNQPRQA